MRSISPGTVTIGVIAIVLGLVAAYVVRRSMEPEESKPRVARNEGVPMVVARVNLPRHTRITAAHLEVKRVPADQLPTGAVQSIPLLVDRITKESIEAGERVLTDQVYDIGERPSLTHKLEPGHRAVPIAVPASNMAATMLHVGDLVDVHLTFEDDRPEIGGLATKTLLKAVRVIAKGTATNRSGSRESPAANHLTLAVTEDQANALITAQRSGTLSVSLCGDREELGQNARYDERMLTKAELLGLKASQPYTVQKWSGTRMDTLVLGGDLVREAREATAADANRRGPKYLPIGNTDPLAGQSRPNGSEFFVGSSGSGK